MKNMDEYRWLDLAGEKLDEEMKRASDKFRKSAFAAAGLVALLLILSYLLSGNGMTPASQLVRNPYGEPGKDIVINAEIIAGEQHYEKELSLNVRPQAVSEAAANIMFDECESWLRAEIIPADEVSSDLELPREYGDGRIALSWHSSDPARISEEGAVDLLNAPPVCYVKLSATMSAGEYARDCSFLLHVVDGDMAPSFERALDDLQQRLSADDEGERLELPDKYNGAQVLWDFPGKSVAWELIPIGGMVVLALYFGRYDAVEKHLRRTSRAFEYEIPSMTLQLILLLNAGLVLSAAFEQLIVQNDDSDHPLYKALKSIQRRCQMENLSFPDELSLFARRTGCRDFIRIATLIADHSARGSELASKLEQERDRLWSGRLSLAKVRAKEADTKLCMPLVLLLLVLVVISAAPALMTM